MEYVRFGELYSIPSSNGVSRPSAVRGQGCKMINMGELFANNIISDISMERVQLSSKEKEKFLVQKNDLLFARQSLVAAGAGKCSIVKQVKEETTFESHLIRVRLNEKRCNPWYYYYLFQLPYNPVKTIVNQCAQAGIRGKELVNIKVPMPNMETQNKIANILSAYDELIENNNKRIAILEQMADKLYKEWFVRFRFPGYKTAEFENGLPKGWNIKRIGEIARVKSGYAFKSEWWTDEGVPVIKIKDIQNNTIDFSDLSKVSEENSLFAKQFVVSEGDLLIAMTGATIGKLALVPYSSEKLVVNQRVGKFFCGNEPISNVAFLYFTLQQNWVQELILMIAGSNAAQPNISPFDIEKIKVLYNDEIVKMFNAKASRYIKQMLLLIRKNQNLIKQRDLLLPRLMSGKLEV